MRKRDRVKSGGVRFSKFTAVGAVNAAVDIGTLNLLLLLLGPTRDPSLLVTYNAVALVLANANSYVWNSLWTFRGRAAHDLWQTLTFAAQALVNILVSNLLFWMLVRPVLVHTDVSTYVAGNVAKAISVSVASTMSFFLMRYLVFSRRRPFRGRL